MSRPFVPRPWQPGMIEHLFEHDRCALWADMGLGKAQPVTEPVLTPTGWRPIGRIQEGDFVIGSDGRETRVLGVFHKGRRQIYRVGFSDGSWTRACGEHLWHVDSPTDRYAGRPGRVLSTEALLINGLRDSAGNRKWSVPLVAPVHHENAALPIEPYLLGVLLGDDGLQPRSVATTPGLRTALKALDLWGKRSWEKHIPTEYLVASAPQRLAILQGLLDTDGRPMVAGGVEYCSTAEALIAGVVELVESLGGVARNKTARHTRHPGGGGRESWRINVKLPGNTEPFRLRRKLAAWVQPTKYPAGRMLDSITPDGMEQAVCIRVAAADSLYVTRHHILTHNSPTVLSFLDAQYMAGESHPTLILGPLRVVRSTWTNEAAKWDEFKHLGIAPVLGTPIERLAALRKDVPIYTCNYDNLLWLTEHFGDRWPFRTVIADESDHIKGHRISEQTAKKADGTDGKTYLKGQGAKRAGALARISHSHVKRFIELTGTPSPNGLADLWGQMWFLDKGKRLGKTYTAFKERWFSTGFDGFSLAPSDFADAQIQDAVRDICLTVKAEDWMPMDKPRINNVWVDLPAKARALYKEMEKDFYVKIGDRSAEAFSAAAKSQKLLQLGNGACYVDPLCEGDEQPSSKEWRLVHDEKIDALKDVIAESCGANLLVCYQFKSDLARLLKAFPQGRALTTKTEEDFRQGKLRLLFVHPKSAGHGIDGWQNHCHQIVFFGVTWALGQYLQVIERVGPVRQMQAETGKITVIHHILARGTMDEDVLERLTTKREIQDILLDACKRVLGRKAA